MARGFLGGLAMGAVVAVGGAGVLSVLTAPPRAPSVSTDIAPDAATPGAPEATAGAVPRLAEREPLQPEAPQVGTPNPEETTALEGDVVEPASRPITAAVAPDVSAPQEIEKPGAVAVAEGDPVSPVPQVARPSAPDTEAAVAVDNQPTQPSATPATPPVADFSAEASPQAPEPGASIEAPAQSEPRVAALPSAPAAPAAPETTERPSVSTTPAVVPTPDPTEETAQPDLRPTIGRPARSLVGRDNSSLVGNPAPDGSGTTAEATTTESTEPLPALEQFRAPFEAEDGRPLLSIVLMDSGQDLGSGPIGLEALGSFPYPLTLAVDATLSDAGARMEKYRAAGFEVMAMLDVPEGLTASDTEVTVSAALDVLPETVAVLEGIGTGLQGSRDISGQVSAILKDSGHGIVWQPKGLDTAAKLAAREGVASLTLFRDFDKEGQTPSVIRRFLDQAAFRAGQEGGVVMVGRVRPDTISALLLWGLQDRAQRVAVAPVSAVLLNEPEG